MLDEFRPRLHPTVRRRHRADGSAALWDERTDSVLEVASDQALLLESIDGKRTVAEIAEAHAASRGFVPFTALNDLLGELAKHGLFANSADELAKVGLTVRHRRVERLATAFLRSAPLPFARVVTALGVLLALGLAAIGARRPELELSGYDVPLVWVGAALALSSRGFFRAAAAAAFGERPTRLRLGACFGVLHLAPGSGGAALLDRAPRAVAHLAAMAGAAVALLGCWPVPGLAAGALMVVLGDLVPFDATSTGKLLSTLAGRVDLRDHARAYLDRRLLARAGAGQLFDGEGSLIVSLLASLAWFTLLIRLVLTSGVAAVLALLAVAVDVATPGLERIFALAGSAGLALAGPVAVAALLWGLVRAALSVRPQRRSATGAPTGIALQPGDLERIPAFARLAADERARLAAVVQELRFRPGELIVRQGDPGFRFFAIRSGTVAVERELPSGLVRKVALLGGGDCFGETALLEDAPRSASVRAVTEVSVAALDRKDFETVVASLGAGEMTRVLRGAAALHKSAFFAQLPAERLSALALKLEPREIRAGAEVVRAGEEGQEFFLVAAGALEVVDAQGVKVAELREGDHFGEIALLRRVPRVATVRAVEDATVLVLDKQEFMEAMAADLRLSAGIETLAAARAGGAA